MNLALFPIEKFKHLETPFYYYNMTVLGNTLKQAKESSSKHKYQVHYAIKANSNRRILEQIAAAGYGADCVSGNEIRIAISAGFPSAKIVFAGVGKTDKEIGIALDVNIACFNVESLPELTVINEIASKKGKIANVALRINPEVDAETHKNITTGLSENKFGLNISQLDAVLEHIEILKNVKLIGIHFHIGSQIQNLHVFEKLCKRAMELQEYFENKKVKLEHLNFGGGLGINYNDPAEMPDFESFFNVFAKSIITSKQVHFELGRSLVAQCGSLISRVTYVKRGENKKFVIIDGSMTELIRPALYQAHHEIENLTSSQPEEEYDIVGPVCESSDTFAEGYLLKGTQRGDIVAIRSAGAYGEVMSSRYNMRDLPRSYFSDEVEV